MISQTEKEMLESKDICKNFDLNIAKKIAQVTGNKKIIFTGMGSSVLFPASQAKWRAMKLGISNTIEVGFASDFLQFDDFSNTIVFLCSNSGKTKEVIMLLEHVQKKGGECIAITAVSDSILANKCANKIILKGGFEKGVASTKSIIEQALIYDSLIFHLASIQGKKVDFKKLRKDLDDTATKIYKNTNILLDKKLTRLAATSELFLFSGLANGVAEEITLKSYEITRKVGIFYPDTHCVHGVAESVTGNMLVVFDPKEFAPFTEDFKRFKEKTGCTLLGIGSNKIFPGLTVETNKTFKNYCLLAGGWALLRNVANELKIDIDHPTKITKVGNPY